VNVINRSSAKKSKAWLVAGAIITVAITILPGRPSYAKQDRRNLGIEQTPATSTSQRRLALVIGNGAYQNIKPLNNPANDARLVASTLRKLGFDVTVETDKSQIQMKRLIREFGQSLRSRGGVGLFFFAGHGVQSRGNNYLIPIDADIQIEADLEDSAVNLNYALNVMDDAQNTLNIAVLDACRDNPFTRSFRSTRGGLAQLRAPTGTLIAYATAPDSVAADGGGANSPYTEELVKQLQLPGVLLETMFRRVTEQVSSRSGGRQEPWFSANVKGDFYFAGEPVEEQANRVSQTIDLAAFELSYWDSIKTSNDPDDFKSYLERFPNGKFAELARRRAARAVPNSQPASVTAANDLKSNSESASANQNLPQISQVYELLRRREFASARKEAKRLSESHPGDSEAWKLAGFAALNLKLYPEAAADLQKALDLQSSSREEDPNTIEALAQAYVLSEEYVRALPLLVRAINGKGSQPDALLLYYRGIAEYKTKHFNDAERSFNLVLTLNPRDALSLFYLAQIALSRNDLDAAIANLSRATVSDPRLTGAWRLLTSAYLRRAATKNNPAQAEADYLNAVRSGEGMIKLTPDTEALILFGQALIGAKQYARATATLERVIMQTDTTSVAFYLLGVAHSRSQNFVKAIAALQTAATKSPDDVNVYRELGYAYEVSRQYAKALEAYRKGLNLLPNDPDFKESINRVQPFAH
jgi:tetratricopeptide (TPR) repeat protein